MSILILRRTLRTGCLQRTLPNFIFARAISSLPSPSTEINAAAISAAPFTSFFWRNDQWSADIRRRRGVASQVATAKIATQANISGENTPAFELYEAQASQSPSLSLPSTSSTTLTSLALPANYPPSPSLVPYRPVPALTPKRLLSLYLSLAKSRLSILIILTTMSSVALSPLPVTVPTLLATAAGTFICSASANTLNQLQEVPYDAQMARTRGRPLVTHSISPLHASVFAGVTSLAGPALLWVAVGPTTAILGAANIFLYAGVYTYLKRRSVINTWVGAVVGGIPPLMGWAACGGQILPSSSSPIHLFLPSFMLSSETSSTLSTLSQSLPSVDPLLANNPLSALALFLFLYSWQFPHFNSLSFFVRASYAQAGYRMLSVISPPKNALVSLRHSIFFVPLCSILFPISGLVDWGFAITSLVPNAIIINDAWKFWRAGGNNEKAARRLFYSSLWYLPLVMGLAMLHKTGLDWSNWLSHGGEASQPKELTGNESSSNTGSISSSRNS